MQLPAQIHLPSAGAALKKGKKQLSKEKRKLNRWKEGSMHYNSKIQVKKHYSLIHTFKHAKKDKLNYVIKKISKLYYCTTFLLA